MTTSDLAATPVAASRDEALSELFTAHYAGLLRLAVLLVDAASAEDVVQDAFARLYGRRGGVRDPERALPYLRSCVLHGARSRPRHRKVVARHAPAGVADAATPLAEHAEVLTALHALPRRQREVLVLRYYLDLTEAGIADTLGISASSVAQHASCGMATLTRTLEAGR